MLDWGKLLNEKRRKVKDKEPEAKQKHKAHEVRTEIERDYDRILFSTPVRRLADKTQVFPLERNDSVRTRLTHSHEVSNLARSIGITIAFIDEDIPEEFVPKRNVPALLAAIGLAHDLGNPPFGHQGEYAIQSWFQDNESLLSDPELTEAMRKDFLKFEGNAQTLRLVTRLQVLNDNYGLNLTYATLAALMKYPTSSDKIDKKMIAKKKHGYFQSEKDIVQQIWNETGLQEGVRHPLTYIMEACDDIAYAVLDAEDAIKKSLVSYSDLITYLKHHSDHDEAVKDVIELSQHKHKEYRGTELSPSELNDVSMQMLRAYAIGQMVRDVREVFKRDYKKILNGDMESDLIDASKSGKFCKLLKKFDREHAYQHKSVLEVELEGYNTIRKLMDFLWKAIDAHDTGSKAPFESYGYIRISENYRRVFEDKENKMPGRYKQLQLLTDMISGMTDSFAISLCNKLQGYRDGSAH